MGVKLPPVWRSRAKATVKGSKLPQPPTWLVIPCRILIELSKQFIFTFAAVQLIRSTTGPGGSRYEDIAVWEAR